MKYEIFGESVSGFRFEEPAKRGRPTPYPFRDLQIGQWFRAPFSDTKQLRRAAKYARRRLGVRVRWAKDGDEWIVQRFA